MAAFFFHECYEDGESFHQVLTLFVIWVKEFNKLVSKNKEIERDIMTNNFPHKVKLSGYNLAELIKNIGDRDTRIVAMKLFTRSPIDEFTDDALLDESMIRDVITCLGKDCFDLYFAHLNGYWAVSVPINSEYENEYLEIFRNEVLEVKMPNWSGPANTASCNERLLDPNRSLIDRVVELCPKSKMTSEFEMQFNNLSLEFQKEIYNRLCILNEQKKLFPPIVGGKCIKSCKGKKIHQLYEIRFLSINYRMYILFFDDCLYFGSVVLKGNGNGKAQNYDMYQALENIKDLF